MATRTRGDLVGVHVRPSDGLAAGPSALLDEHRELLEGLGGEYHEIAGADVATALTDFARRRERHPARPGRQRPVAVGRARAAAR